MMSEPDLNSVSDVRYVGECEVKHLRPCVRSGMAGLSFYSAVLGHLCHCGLVDRGVEVIACVVAVASTRSIYQREGDGKRTGGEIYSHVNCCQCCGELQYRR